MAHPQGAPEHDRDIPIDVLLAADIWYAFFDRVWHAMVQTRHDPDTAIAVVNELLEAMDYRLSKIPDISWDIVIRAYANWCANATDDCAGLSCTDAVRRSAEGAGDRTAAPDPLAARVVGPETADRGTPGSPDVPSAGLDRPGRQGTSESGVADTATGRPGGSA